MRLLCFFGLHRRSREHAWHDGTDVVSVCKGCHAPMVKGYLDGKWRLQSLSRVMDP
jgi:hypothetical protein